MLTGMDAALASLPLETLQSRLTEALTAQHELLTGARVVSVRTDSGRSVQYSEAQSGQLATYIANLQAAIRVKQGGASRRPIYVVT